MRCWSPFRSIDIVRSKIYLEFWHIYIRVNLRVDRSIRLTTISSSLNLLATITTKFRHMGILFQQSAFELLHPKPYHPLEQLHFPPCKRAASSCRTSAAIVRRCRVPTSVSQRPVLSVERVVTKRLRSLLYRRIIVCMGFQKVGRNLNNLVH